MSAGLTTFAALLRGMPRRGSHGERLDGFYAAQASSYDAVRTRMLHGREPLLAAMRQRIQPGWSIAEIGCGTGRNLEALGPALDRCSRVWGVDLCAPMLEQARGRASRLGWDRVELVHADALVWEPPARLDAVICSYTLTMMPCWRAVVDRLPALVRPGGLIAVADFTVPSADPPKLQRRRTWLTRAFWPRWFAHAGVHPHPDLAPSLLRVMRPELWIDAEGPLPWLPGLRAPYLVAVGPSAHDLHPARINAACVAPPSAPVTEPQ